MALLKYILKKMLMLLPVLVGISIIAFALGIIALVPNVATALTGITTFFKFLLLANAFGAIAVT